MSTGAALDLVAHGYAQPCGYAEPRDPWRRLWLEVLNLAVEDAETWSSYKGGMRARAFLCGELLPQDLEMVCNFAGVDLNAIVSRFRGIYRRRAA